MPFDGVFQNENDCATLCSQAEDVSLGEATPSSRSEEAQCRWPPSKVAAFKHRLFEAEREVEAAFDAGLHVALHLTMNLRRLLPEDALPKDARAVALAIADAARDVARSRRIPNAQMWGVEIGHVRRHPHGLHTHSLILTTKGLAPVVRSAIAARLEDHFDKVLPPYAMWWSGSRFEVYGEAIFGKARYVVEASIPSSLKIADAYGELRPGKREVTMSGKSFDMTRLRHRKGAGMPAAKG